MQRIAPKEETRATLASSTAARVGQDNEKPAEKMHKQTFPPRIVYYDGSSPNPGEIEIQHLRLSDDSAETVQHSTSETKSVEEHGKSERSDGVNVTIAGSKDGDDEDSEAILEDKNALGTHEVDNPQDTEASDECVPLAEWQSSNPVSCNTIHEIDLFTSILNAGKQKKKREKTRLQQNNMPSTQLRHELSRHPSWNESQIKFLGQGWFRAAWKLDRHLPSGSLSHETADNDGDGETVILKMLRSERDFTAEFYELHRIDAVAMEQLTHSKFVLNVFGYCGQSALNEFASFRIPQLSSLEKFDRQLRGKDSPRVNRLKLKLAVSVAMGVAHVHELPADISGDNRPTMAHYDINPRNVAICKGGLPKLNDFNVAHFLKYNPRTNQTCGFDSRLHEPWWRAPEEVSLANTSKLTHAVDVWSLGNLLFHILTSHSPRGKMKDYRMESVREEVFRGKPPSLPTELLESKDPAAAAFREAMQMCFVKDPSDRATAREVSNVLMDAYMQLMEDNQSQENKKRQ